MEAERGACRLCDRRLPLPLTATNLLSGEVRGFCEECVEYLRDVLIRMDLLQMGDVECDHFHEGDEKDIANAVEEFFRR